MPDDTKTTPNQEPTSNPNPPLAPTKAPTPEPVSTQPTPRVQVESEPDTAPVSTDTQPAAPGVDSSQGSVISGGAVPKPKKKGLLIGGIIAILILLLGGGAALAYNFWYQNPEKVLTDAVGNALRAKSVAYAGTLTAENTEDKSTIKIEISSASDNTGKGTVDATLTLTADDKSYTFKGAALTDSKGDLYVQAKDIRPLYDSYAEEIGAVLPEALDAFVDKINNKWIRISSSDLKELGYTTNDDVSKCLSDASKKLMGDEATAKELRELYEKNKFVVIDKKLGSRGDSLGYTLKGDEAAAKSFAKGLKDTAIYKEFQKCDESFEINEDDLFKEAEDSDVTATYEVWVSRWGHEFTEFKIDGKTTDMTLNASLKPTFNKPVTAETPSEFLTIKELQDELTSIFEELYSSYDLLEDYDYTTEEEDFYLTN